MNKIEEIRPHMIPCYWINFIFGTQSDIQKLLVGLNDFVGDVFVD